MLIYIILISTICIFSLICFNRFTKYHSPQVLKMSFLSTSFFFLFVCSALRMNIGYDYRMYVQGFELMGRDGFSTLTYLDWEWGFNIMTKLIYLITKDPHIYMAIIAAICLAGPYYVIYRYSKKIWLSVLLYINLYFFYCTMNFLRQSIAISIVLFAYTFLTKRKFWRFSLLILIAATFHTTVLIMIPAYFMTNFKPSLRIPLLYAYLVLWVFISSNATLDLLTEAIHSEYRNSVFLTLGLSFIHAIIPTMITGAGMFVMLRFVKPANIADGEKPFVMQTNLMYFSYLWILIMLRHGIFERFSYYTYILVILYIPELIAFADEKYKDYVNKKFNAKLKNNALPEEEQKKIITYYKRTRKILNIALILLAIAIPLAYNLYGLTVYARGPHGIYPYQSWMNS